MYLGYFSYLLIFLTNICFESAGPFYTTSIDMLETWNVFILKMYRMFYFDLGPDFLSRTRLHCASLLRRGQQHAAVRAHFSLEMEVVCM